MAYRNSYNYKGGSKKVRDSRRVKRGLRIAGWTVLWLFVGMLVTHLIFSVASKTKKTVGELASEGIAPITTRMDEVNSQLVPACWLGGDFTDSYKTDELIALLKRKGITEAVLDIKPESGMLAYASDLQTARRLDAVPEGAPELGRIIVKFKNAGIKTIARLSLYVDDVAATDLKHCAVESREVTETETDEEGNETTVVRNEKVDALWHDRSGHAWRSPFDPDAVEYCGELIAELAQGGVDAVLIDNVRFPNAGDGDDGSVVFPEEESAELPRAGALRQNISTLRSAAQSAGVRFCVALDAQYCCGEQDARAGISFNVFDLKADVVCPKVVVSRLEADGVTSVGTYTFDSTAGADVAQLMEAFCAGLRMVQGAVDEPPAAMPVIQAYADSLRPAFVPEDMKTQFGVLNKNLINGRIIYGPSEELDRLLPDA
ncbi:MAG: hypothetical protein IJL83_01265 [Clostridia bacterium]|nr:hypothetical protein [Clostridia bacterium]